MSELDVEELLKSELAKVRTPKAPPLKQFHAMLEHTMKLLPDIDDIVSAADKKDVQLRDAQAANNELLAQLKEVLGDQEDKDDRINSLEQDLARITLRRDEAIQANQELVKSAAAYKRDKDSAEKKLADLLLELEEHDAEIIRLKIRRNELLAASYYYYGSFSYELGCVLTFPFRFFAGQDLFPRKH